MSAPAQEDTRIYPGGVERYRAARKLREELETGENVPQSDYLAAAIVEELAGLAYILDGIRYAARQTPPR